MVEAKMPEERRIQLINQQKQGGASALYLACPNGKAEVAEHLIAVRACIHQALETKETPLYIASQGIHQALETKETPLYIASQGGHEAIVRLLLQEEADAKQGKHDRATPLYIACQNQHTTVSRSLMDARADPHASNVNGATPLFISSQKGFHEIVRELLEAGADPTLAIQSGACPLYIAARRAEAEFANRMEATPLFIASQNDRVEILECLRLLGERACIDETTQGGASPLYIAAQHGSMKESNGELPVKLAGKETVPCCDMKSALRRLDRGACNKAREESPQPKWFSSMMDKMYGSMDVTGKQIEDLLSLVQGSDLWHRLRKEVADSYARIGREAVEKRKGPSQASLARVDTNARELQGTVALTACNILKHISMVKEKSDEDVSKDVEQFVDGTVHELLKMRRSVLDSTREHFLADSVQLSCLNRCVQELVPTVEDVHSDDIRDEVSFYPILKEIPTAFVVANQTDFLSASFAELVETSKQLQQVLSLHEAMKADEKLNVKDLIAKTADLNRTYHHPDHGKLTLTPLCHAVALNSPELIELLLGAGADLACKPSPIRFADELGRSANDAFSALAQFPECLRAEDITAAIISRLAKANADINFADGKGRTALHHWAAAGDTELVTALAEDAAQLDQRDADGKTPLDLAAELPGACEELLKVLEYVELCFGLGGEQLAVSRSLLEDAPDVVDFLRHLARRKWLQEGKQVQHFCILVMNGDQLVNHRTSWQCLGKPVLSIIRNKNLLVPKDFEEMELMDSVGSYDSQHEDILFLSHLSIDEQDGSV